MVGGQQEDGGGKGDNADPPTGHGIRNRSFCSCLSLFLSRRHQPRHGEVRENQNLSRPSPWIACKRTLFCSRHQENCDTHVSIDLRRSHTWRFVVNVKSSFSYGKGKKWESVFCAIRRLDRNFAENTLHKNSDLFVVYKNHLFLLIMN